MKCRITGCEREAVYTSAKLCRQHYDNCRRPGWKKPDALVAQAWEDAYRSVMADRAVKERALNAMRRAAYREDAC